MRRKPVTWGKYARMVAAARGAACLYAVGWAPWPAVMQTFPEDVRKELETFRPEQSERLDESPDESDKAHRWRWLKRLAMQFVERDPEEPRIPTTTATPGGDYTKCFAVSRAVFTDAALKAAGRRFKFFPGPEALRNFLTEWGEKHRPSKPSDKDRCRRNLVLTDQARSLLLTARAGTAVANGPVRRLTDIHVQIAEALACWPTAQPSHEELARKVGASIRTVRRALPALRILRLLTERDSSETKKMPRHVHGFERIMRLIAAHAGVPMKTLYRWEQDYRALQRGATLLAVPMVVSGESRSQRLL